MRVRTGLAIVVLAAGVAGIAGCATHGQRLENPLPMTGTSVATAEKVAQRVLQELRFQIIYPRVSEGRIETGQLTGASWFEFWRDDTVPQERAESSFHTVRRRVAVAISPKDAGIEIRVKAMKERLSAPGAGPQSLTESVGVHTTVDKSLLSRWDELAPTSYEWVDEGHDEALEQMILERIRRVLDSGTATK